MEFGILGSLQVCDGDREITVSGHKQRGLLAFLLLHANQSVSEDVLIEALWGDQASDKAGRNLHVLVSRLRASIGGDRVAREAGGYLIRVEQGELDIDRFESLRHEQRDPPLRGAAARRPGGANRVRPRVGRPRGGCG